MTRRRVLIAAWLVLLGLSASLPLSAFFRGILHVGPVPFRATGMLRRPLISVGSDVLLPRGAKSVVIAVLGNIQVSGRAHDDLVALGGRVYLHPRARADGDILTVLGGIYRAPDVTTVGRLGGAIYPWNGTSPPPPRAVWNAFTTSVKLGLAAGLALLLVGTCLTVVFPWQVVLISTTLRTAPLKSAGAGLVSLVAFMFLVVPLGLSLAGLPFALLLSGAASLAWLFGMTAAAVLVGRAMARGTVPLLWATAAGLITLALVLAIPVVGPLTVTTLGLAGSGALAVSLANRAGPAAPLL